ncbi:MAG TPA: ROK family protein [Gemmataceae bacterium]|jgi:polyphosphate glucokinase|nr:ROK family protein [Gemmataceae bacterium]
MKILVIDVGGTHLKVKVQGNDEVRKCPSGPELTPADMVGLVRTATADWDYDHVSIGYPGPVVNGRIMVEPVNLGPGWVGFDFAAALGKPVRIVNDAAMQALGSYEGGRMLFLGLGTGLGSTLVLDGVLAPMELGHLPYKKARSFEEYVGQAGLKRLGRRKWQETVFDVVDRLKKALLPDYVVLGGGNVKKLDALPPDCRPGDNSHAFQGGVRLWERDTG